MTSPYIIKTDSKITSIDEDNKVTIQTAGNPVFHGRTKHIDRRFHFTRDHVEQVCQSNIVQRKKCRRICLQNQFQKVNLKN